MFQVAAKKNIQDMKGKDHEKLQGLLEKMKKKSSQKGLNVEETES